MIGDDAPTSGIAADPRVPAELAAAAAAEHDAAPFVARHIIGPVRLDAATSSPLRWQVVADTGPRRPTDGPLERLILVDLVSQERVRPDRPLSWQDGELRLEGTDELPAGLIATAETTGSGGHGWYLVTEGGPPIFPAARADALARLTDRGAGRATGTGGPLAALLAERPAVGPPGPLRLVAGRGSGTVIALLPGLLADGGRVLVITDAPDADRTALTIDAAIDRPDPGRIIRLGMSTRHDLARHPRVGLDAAVDRIAAAERAELERLEVAARRLATREGTWPPTGTAADTHGADAADRGPANPTVPTVPPAASDDAVDLARAIAAEARAIRIAAEAEARRAAVAHQQATAALRALHDSNEGFRRLEELAARAELAGGELAASARGVGRLATEVRLSPPEDRSRLQAQLVAAAKVAADGLHRRAELLELLDDQHRRLQAQGASRRRVQQAEQRAHRARMAHAEADAAVQQARREEQRAEAEMRALTATAVAGPPAPTRSAVTSPGAAPAGTDAPVVTDLRDATGSPDPTVTWARLRADHRAAAARRVRPTAAALARASVVVSTAEDVVVDPAAAGWRVDHVVVDHANSFPLVTLALLAARATGTLTLVVDGREQPAAPACADPARRRWLATSVLELLGDVDR